MTKAESEYSTLQQDDAVEKRHDTIELGAMSNKKKNER